MHLAVVILVLCVDILLLELLEYRRISSSLRLGLTASGPLGGVEASLCNSYASSACSSLQHPTEFI